MPSQIDTILLELQRRIVILRSTTTLGDGSQLGYNGDPNNAVAENTAGEFLIYNSPMATRYTQDDGVQWYKKERPNVWKKFGEGSGGGTTSPDVMIDMGLFTEIPPRTTVDCGGF